MPEKMIVSFPHMGSYAAVFSQLFGRLFPRAVIMPPPPISAKTLELGAKHSPDFVCAPFKYNLGNYIQALEQGANVLLQAATGCRYGYYAELQEQILRDMGYQFQFACFSYRRMTPGNALRQLRGLGCPLPVRQILRAIVLAGQSIRLLDRYEYWMREHMAFEAHAGECEAAQKQLLLKIEHMHTQRDYRAASAYVKHAMEHIHLTMPERPLRVGIVGELYTLMEPFSTFDVETHLAREGVAVSRRMGLWFLLRSGDKRRAIQNSGDYMRCHVGANGVDSVSQSINYAKMGYDGVLHLKSFGCVPELNAGPALMNVSRDYNIPMLSLSFDTHSSQTGMQTRLEAFIDMLRMRREEPAHGSKAGG